MSTIRLLCCLLPLVGCVSAPAVKRAVDETTAALDQAHGWYAPQCVPEVMARAEAEHAFAQLELRQGSLRRGSEHAFAAMELAREAALEAKPCGTRDGDRDQVPDVVDACPEEPEDHDGDRDEDGCLDLEAYGDQDGDRVRNIDDDCPLTPEDFDGDHDEDGCPETSADRDGDSIVDGLDQCPERAEDLDGYLDSDGCPDTDNDQDGLADMLDICPKVAEDEDGWQDEDGCPDPDNDADGLPDTADDCPNEPGERLLSGCPAEDDDGDGVADPNDRCPTEAETHNKYLDDDGCPDTPPERVSVTQTRVNIHETIQFATGSATLLPASHRVLGDIYKVLTDAEEMRLRIEGHTDNKGTEVMNYRLSKERAESVKVYLSSLGVDPSRLMVVGYGETRPIDTNRTTAGRAQNRRVEFHIID